MKLSYLISGIMIMTVLVLCIGRGMSSLSNTLEARHDNIPESIRHLMDKN